MRILIFGATGSIGTQALDIIKKQKHQLVGFSFNQNEKLAKKIKKLFNVKYVYANNKFNIVNVNSNDELILKTKPDLIINAISGYKGLEISLLSIKHKIDLALANKETLVIGGKFIRNLCIKNKVNIYPIDSEHSSIYDVLINNKKKVKKIIITCSGGAFYNHSKKQLENICINDALKHPNWSMGEKITIDSSTLINKCFEIVEAYWLFNTKNIIALYHPQSIAHCGIQFDDNSYFFNCSVPDMHIAIDLAINKFKQLDKPCIKELDFTKLNLHFDYIDINKYKPIKWAYDIINDNNNSLGTIINVSNDIAVNKFLQNQIKFNEIIPYIEKNIKLFSKTKITKISDIKQLITNIEEVNK